MKLDLITGWAVDADVLRPLADALQQLLPDADIMLHNLPHWANNQLDSALNSLEAQLREQSYLIGWSLGGMLAMQLAARAKQPYAGVITLASNACFVQQANWQTAMAQEVFAAFYQGCHSHLATTLKRFALLCSQGGKNSKKLRSQFALAPALDTQQAILGLDLLRSIDNHRLYQQLTVPQLHLFAADDALVPIAAMQPLSVISQCRVLAGGHLFVLEQAAECAQHMQLFIQEQLCTP